MYHLTPAQANVLGAPVGANMFAEMDKVYSRDNASAKAQYGTSTVDAMNYDAANRQFFNDTLALGVDCGRLNASAGRPNVGFSGSACYAPSQAVQRAAKAADSAYNSYGPTADQIVLAQGDVRYAPSRFAAPNNYNGVSINDGSYQPRLMGTRDAVPAGCTTNGSDQLYGNVSSCGFMNDAAATDPRVGYGVDSPNTDYWSPLELGEEALVGCQTFAESTMCNVNDVSATLARNRVHLGARHLSPQHRQRK